MSEKKDSLFDLAKLKDLGGLRAGDLLAVDPQLYSKFMEHLSRTVKHDDVTKNMVFLTGLSAYTPEPNNLFLRGESSIGKTYNVVQALKYFPEDDVWFLAGLSPTALIHSRGTLVDKNGQEILFEEKPTVPKKSHYDTSADYQAALSEYKAESKIWKKKMDESRYLVELSHKIIVFLEAPHLKTFYMLRPILSHDKHEISYKFTDKTAKGQLRTQHVVIRGWPSTIFCTTEEKHLQDLATRCFTITPEVTKEKIKDANILTGSKAAFPWQFDEDPDIMLLQSYIQFLKKNLEDLKVVVPYGEQFGEMFAHRFPRSMRDCKHVLNLQKVFALFHLAQRPILIRKIDVNDEQINKKYALVTRADHDFIMDMWERIRETTETSAPGHIIKFFYKVVLPLSKIKDSLLINDLVDGWNSEFDDRRSSDCVRNWIRYLSDVNYVSTQKDPSMQSRNIITVVKKAEESIKPTINGFSEFFNIQKCESWLKQAKQTYRDHNVFLKDKFFSDEEISIEDIHKKYFMKTALASRYVLSPSKEMSLTETTVEKTDKPKIVDFTSFNPDDVLKLEPITVNVQDTCLECNKQGRMSWQVTLHDQTSGQLCRDCGLTLSNKRGAVE